METGQNGKNERKSRRAAMLYNAGALCIAILFFFALYSAEGIGTTINFVVRVLRPFVIGFVIAYLLLPICDFFEAWFCRIAAARKKKKEKRNEEAAKNRAEDSGAGTKRRASRIRTFFGRKQDVVKDLIDVDSQKKKTWPERLAVLCAMAVGFLIVAALSLMMVPQLIKSITSLTNTVPAALQQLVDFSKHELENSPQLYEYARTAYGMLREQFDDVGGWVTGTLLPYLRNILDGKSQLLPQMGGVLDGVGSGVRNVIVSIKDALVGVFVAIYSLSSRKKIFEDGELCIRALFGQAKADAIITEICFSHSRFKSFLCGKLLDSAIIGVICYIFCICWPMPNALLVSVIVGITNIVPFFGPFIGAVPTTLLIMMESLPKGLVFIVFIFALQQVDGNVLGPAILGKNMEVSSLAILFSVILFGGLFGFAGMIIGVPLYAVIGDVLEQLLVKGLRKRGRGEEADALQKEIEERHRAAIKKQNILS